MNWINCDKVHRSLHCLLCSYVGAVITIEEHPSSILIAVNQTAQFSCKADCIPSCLIFWKINDTLTDDNEEPFEQKGFTFFRSKENRTYFMTLIVNATEEINNTEVQCIFELSSGIDSALENSIESKNATLLVIAGT